MHAGVEIRDTPAEGGDAVTTPLLLPDPNFHDRKLSNKSQRILST